MTDETESPRQPRPGDRWRMKSNHNNIALITHVHIGGFNGGYVYMYQTWRRHRNPAKIDKGLNMAALHEAYEFHSRRPDDYEGNL